MNEKLSDHLCNVQYMAYDVAAFARAAINTVDGGLRHPNDLSALERVLFKIEEMGEKIALDTDFVRVQRMIGEALAAEAPQV